MLLVTRIGRVPAGFGGFIVSGSKVSEQVLHWERRGDRVMLRKVSFNQVAEDSLPSFDSVVRNNFAPILEAFDVEAIGPDGDTVVIDVTDFYSGDTPALSGLSAAQRKTYEARSLDADRSFINYARSYPRNVDVRHTLTFAASGRERCDDLDGDAPVDGAPARKPDDATPPRRPRRLLLVQPGELRPRRTQSCRANLYPALASGTVRS